MKTASPNVVPNVFVKQACMGNAWAAQAAWTKPRASLKGYAPYEIWNNPELLLTNGELEEHPNCGPLMVVTVRMNMVRSLAQIYSHESALPPPGINLPIARTVREVDPASIVDLPHLLSSPHRNHHRGRQGLSRFRSR